MKYLFTIIICFSFNLCLIAQGLINNGGHIFVGNNSVLIINSGAFTNVTNVTDGSVNLGGSIEMIGSSNWINNATGTLDLSANSGTVRFSGSGAQTIGGTTVANPSSVFKNLTVNNAGGVSLANHIGVSLALTMTNGDLDMQNSNIDLSTAGYITGETNSNRIKATGGGDGRLKATRNIVAGANNNIAGLRISLVGGTYIGSKIIYRGHKIQPGTGSFTANSSSSLYYLLPDNPQFGSNPQVTINYFDAEFATNGTASESNLEIFQQIQQGGTPWFTPLSPVITLSPPSSSTITNTASPYDSYVTPRMGLITFNGLVTLGSTDKPLPITLVDFNTICDEKTIKINWKTASEINNDFFTVEKSIDAVSWSDIGIVQGKGNSNTILNYSFIDQLSTSNVHPEIVEGQLSTIFYYRLKQTDFNGESIISNVVGCTCMSNENSNIFFNLLIADSPEKKEFTLSFNSQTGMNYYIVIFDQLGRKLYFKKYITSENNERILISKEGLATGVYNLVLYNSFSAINKKIAIINK